MKSLRSGLKDWLGTAPGALDRLDVGARVEHVGRVVRVGDGVASVAGLPQTRLSELLRFEDGSIGLGAARR